jgi:hypothetical protein
MDATNRLEKVDLRAEPAGNPKDVKVACDQAERDEVVSLERSQAAGLVRLARLCRGAA